MVPSRFSGTVLEMIIFIDQYLIMVGIFTNHILLDRFCCVGLQATVLIVVRGSAKYGKKSKETQVRYTLKNTIHIKGHSKWFDFQNGCCFDRLCVSSRSRFKLVEVPAWGLIIRLMSKSFKTGVFSGEPTHTTLQLTMAQYGSTPQQSPQCSVFCNGHVHVDCRTPCVTTVSKN